MVVGLGLTDAAVAAETSKGTAAGGAVARSHGFIDDCRPMLLANDRAAANEAHPTGEQNSADEPAALLGEEAWSPNGCRSRYSWCRS